MLKIIVGVFLILHGLVHLLYAGHSWRLFELRPGLLWPDGSWLFSKLVGDGAARLLASIALVVAALGFIVGGVLELFLQNDGWRAAAVGAAALSSAIYLLFWDGKLDLLDAKGGIGLLINVAILVVTLVFMRPS